MKVLIANRGEIACRIARTAASMGIETVGVYSDPDRNAVHTDAVDVAVALGGATPAESYLRGDAVIQAALDTHCDAVHPGYGFLAENAEFAQAVVDAGLVWVGPTPDQIRLLGDKIAAKRAAIEAGVPTTPIVEIADARLPGDVPMPALVKAAAGGGGRGMRIVRDPSELAEAVEAASREATSAFGDGTVFIEPYLERGRHIEVQIMGDAHGNVVHFHERDCSVQRRNQKIIEECPSPIMTEKLRKKLGEASIALAKAVNYENAGTIEFLVDEDRNFYFMEMNTRIQVEHPITEEVYGCDLVKQQLQIASGQPLSHHVLNAVPRHHSIECRINAEDPLNKFAPSPGKLRGYRSPGGIGIRVDSGVYTRYTIPSIYDPMISKLIAWGKDRQEAITRMRRALYEYIISGVKTNINFHKAVLENPRFVAGDLSTHFIATETTLLDDTRKIMAREQPLEEKLTEIFDQKRKVAAVAAVAAVTQAQHLKKQQSDD